MAAAGKQVKKEIKKYVPVKTSFTSPFAAAWTPLPQEDMQFILKTLKDKLLSTGLEKKEVKVFRPWQKKKGKKPAAAPEPVPPGGGDARGQESPGNGWTDVAARKQLAIGINEVTKALERNELKLLLVCKSAKPKHVTHHLIALSATRGARACQVPRLSHSVSELLGLKSVLALGFRRCDPTEQEVFADTVDAITPRVPPLGVAWLQPAAPTAQPEGAVDLTREEEAGEKKSQKRKLESDSEEVTPRERPSSCPLQPLQVKRIVANPAKKRKTKVKS